MQILRAFAAALACALAVPAGAGPLAPSKPSQLVTAWTVGEDCSNDVDSARFNTMRTLAVAGDQPLAIPAKQALVITRAELRVGGAPANAPVSFYLTSVRNGTLSLLAETSVVVDAAGSAVVRIELPTGVAARSGDELCVSGSSGSFLGTLNGFFAKDR